MARRRTGNKQKVGIDTDKFSYEARAALFALGNEVMGELAEMIAKEANANAPVLQEVQPENSTQPMRRGPNKHGEANDGREGPIKGKIFAQQSEQVLNSWLICSPAWYSHFVEYGTVEHGINPKNKTLLSFPGTHGYSGQQIAVGHVDHPGVKAKPFLRPAVDKAEEFLNQILRAKGWK